MAQSSASLPAGPGARFLRLATALVGLAAANGLAAGQTVIDMPRPPKATTATTYESFQANGATTAPAAEAEDEPAPEVDRAAGRAALDSYAFARRSPRVLRPFPHVLPPGVAQTWPGPSGISVFPSWRWGWGGWGWGPGWGWPGCGWGWGGVGIGVGHVGGGSAPMFRPSSFRFTPGR